jgi:hypothetical protein
MKFSKSFWILVVGGAVIASAGIIGTICDLSFPEKWNTGIIYSRFWNLLPDISMLAVCVGFALIALWLAVAFITKLVLHFRFRGVRLMEGSNSAMKTSQFIFVCLLVFALSCSLGFFVGVRAGFHQAYTKEYSDYMERGSENLEFEARAYMRCLHNIDSGDITNLHNDALTSLRYYVSDVHDMHKMGYTWAPHIPWLYSNAVVYVREHPQQASGKSRRPNTSLEPTPTAP